VRRRSSFRTPVRSNFFLKRFSARSTVSATKKRTARRLFAVGTVGSELVNSFLLLLTLGDAGLLEERAATQLFQNASALEFLLEALQRTVNGFVVFDLNDNHIER